MRSRVVVFNGRGSEITAEITAIEKGSVHLKELISAKDRTASLRHHSRPSDSEREKHGSDHPEGDGAGCRENRSAACRIARSCTWKKRNWVRNGRNGSKWLSRQRSNPDRIGFRKLRDRSLPNNFLRSSTAMNSLWSLLFRMTRAV